MPKGIDSIWGLPVAFSTVVLNSLSNSLVSLEIRFTGPDFSFMPKMALFNVTGTAELLFLERENELNLYLGGYS